MTKAFCYEDLSADTMAGHTRAFLKIQDGCNQFCTYCIIPYLRGRIRSRKAEDILREAGAFSRKGFRELVLTGIHLSSYGKDLEGAKDLGDVIRLLDCVPGIERVRVGSLEPRLITEPFLRTLSGLDHFCPHFHLSLQSGSDSVLKRMNRHYTAEEYYQSVCLLREYFPGAAVTTDIITGFPGETEEEFEETFRFAEKTGFYEIHIFPYSARKGTKAAAMPGQLSRAVKAERAQRLAALTKEQSRAFRAALTGKEAEILTEEEIVIGGVPYVVGSTREYVRCAAPAGTAVNALVRGTAAGFLTDEILLLGACGEES
jgi:threonylcarbamoyladenosine tRNA methylthiotransferase MtaB